MQFSVSFKDSEEPKDHVSFGVVTGDGWPRLMEYSVKRFWSPIVWFNGYRKGINFFFSDLFVLDFDKGYWSLEDASAFCKNGKYAYLIGITKNHQKFKEEGGVCDRFRIVIPWAERIKDRECFKQNMLRITAQFPADQKCKDAAREFRPFRDIIEFSEQGQRMPFRPYTRPCEPEPTREPTAYQTSGLLPRWLRAMMVERPLEGDRNDHIFKLACKLAEHGFSEQRCIEEALAAPTDLPREEVIRTAKSGYANRRRS